MEQIARRSPKPSKAQKFDGEFDIVVVGAGGVGLAAALFSALARKQGGRPGEGRPRSAARPSRPRSGTGCRTTSR